jgi:predicted ATPase
MIMKYTVLNTGEEYRMNTLRKKAYLIEDQWEDSFRYSTMYDFYILNDIDKYTYIGSIKIGQADMDVGQRRPNIPREFDSLPNNFFSLGQSDYYYSRLNEIGTEERFDVLKELRDIASDLELFKQVRNKNVTTTSLLRDLTEMTVKEQFHRIAKGGTRLTPYKFKYFSSTYNLKSDPMKFSFSVIPDSNPPTNIHVIIGRNGVGKTHLIKNMLSAIVLKERNEEIYGKFVMEDEETLPFTRVLVVSFSAFDDMVDIKKSDTKIPYIKVGLPHNYSENDKKNSTQEKLADEFAKGFIKCANGARSDLFEMTIQGLKSDPIFSESGILEFCNADKQDRDEITRIFRKLSSGHKVIILTIVKLVQYVEEKTLVILDEPEGHLHPPLVSTFIRALSDLLVDRNGVAIIATHSPVILQEVPRSCVWKLRRNGANANIDRLQIESFGESVAALTNEVFGLEVTHSGYHKMLQNAVNEGAKYEDILRKFNNELGNEARYLLRMLLAEKKGGSKFE